MVRWRSKLIFNIRNFYESKFKEKDVPHIYAICLVSLIDFFIIFSSISHCCVLDKKYIISICIFLLMINTFIYMKVTPAKGNILVQNIVYLTLFIISLLFLYIL